MAKSKKVARNFYFEQKVFETFFKCCGEIDKSMNAVVNDLVKKFNNKHKTKKQ